MYPGALSLKKP